MVGNAGEKQKYEMNPTFLTEWIHNGCKASTTLLISEIDTCESCDIKLSLYIYLDDVLTFGWELDKLIWSYGEGKVVEKRKEGLMKLL